MIYMVYINNVPINHKEVNNMALIGKFLTTELSKEKQQSNRANNGTSKRRVTIDKAKLPKIKKKKKKKKSQRPPAKWKQALSHTGNEYQSMTYDELAETSKALAGEVRRRLKNIQEGRAYTKLRDIAEGREFTKGQSGIFVDEEGNIKISVKTKGKNALTMAEMRTLRKNLYNYLKDETSTKEGLEKHRQQQAKVFQLEDVWDKEDMTLGDLFDTLETAAELIKFAQTRLDWESGEIKAAIIEAGGYGHVNVKKLKRIINRALKGRKKELLKPMPDFFYSQGEEIEQEDKPGFFF